MNKSFQIAIALSAFSAALELGTDNNEHFTELILAEVEATIAAEIELEAECGHCGCGCAKPVCCCTSCSSSSISSESDKECPLYEQDLCAIQNWCKPLDLTM